MFDLDVLLEYLKVLIWPIMIIYVVETFRRQIAQFINRLSKAQLPGGFVFDAEKQKTQEITPKQEEQAEKTLETQTTSSNDDELALKDMQIDFERTYNLIFGSQLWLLHVLRNTPSGISSSDLVQYFAQQKQQFPEMFENWMLENYLQLLIKKGFCELNEPTQSYKITARGIAFLSYISDLGYSLSKPL